MDDRIGCGSVKAQVRLGHGVHDDDVTMPGPPNFAELIILDESGEEGIDDEVEEGELKMTGDDQMEAIAVLNSETETEKKKDDNEAGMEILQRAGGEHHDSDIEIVSRGGSPNSVESRQSYLLNGDLDRKDEMHCQNLDCPFKTRLHSLMKRYRHLRHELNRQRKTSRSTRMIIDFPDKSFAKKYRNTIDNYVKMLITADEGHTIANNTTATAEARPTDEDPRTPVFNKFIVDKTGHSDSPFAPSIGGIHSTPFFERRFEGSLLCATGSREDKETAEALKPPMMSCFNCLGNHQIADCTLPRDSIRIAQNRNEFMQKKLSSNSPRYHIDDHRSNKFAPGKISDALRNALGLKRNELPIYIYKMRMIGYPPGWFKETEVYDSGLTVYNSEGKGTNDPSKLVDFPGFNVPLQEGTIDDWKRLGCLPMQQKHKRHVMEEQMREAVQKKRKNSEDIELTDHQKEQCPKVVDMDMDEVKSDDDLPGGSPNTISNDIDLAVTMPVTSAKADAEATPKRDSHEAPLEDTREGGKSPDTTSLSLEDLENVKRSLISALDDGDTVDVDVDVEAVAGQSTASFSGKSKAVFLGSPAIYQASPYLRLPDADKFAAGISEHLIFENLPNATGNFEKMQNVLKNVRKLKCLSESK